MVPNSLTLLYFYAITWLILNINMSKLLDKTGIDNIAFLKRGKYKYFFLKNCPRKEKNNNKPISQFTNWANAYIYISCEF